MPESEEAYRKHIDELKDLLKRQKEIGGEMRRVIDVLDAATKANTAKTKNEPPKESR